MGLTDKVINKARHFICKQKINELERSIRHWPTSAQVERRKRELEDLKEELREYEVGYEN